MEANVFSPGRRGRSASAAAIPPPAAQIGLHLLDFTGWTVGEHADRAHTDHDLAGWVGDMGNFDPTPARLTSTPHRPVSRVLCRAT
jgi:hypothetical protein